MSAPHSQRISRARISELWKQAMRDIAAGFFRHSFVLGEREKSGQTVPQYFAHLLIAELSGPADRDAVLDEVIGLIERMYENADNQIEPTRIRMAIRALKNAAPQVQAALKGQSARENEESVGHVTEPARAASEAGEERGEVIGKYGPTDLGPTIWKGGIHMKFGQAIIGCSSSLPQTVMEAAMAEQSQSRDDAPAAYRWRWKEGVGSKTWNYADTVSKINPFHGDLVIEPLFVSAVSERGAWIRCDDRLPEPEVLDGETAPFVPVLFFIDTADEGNAVCAGRYYPNERRAAWKSLQGAPYRRDEVTHWMLIPTGPAERNST